MRVETVRATLLLSTIALGVAVTGAGAVTLQDRQQAACYNDVQKLCGDLVPDVDKVAVCMKSKRQQVSPACSRFYEGKPAG